MATETRVDRGGLVATKVERGPTSAHVALRVNGTERLVDLEPRTSLLDALRDHLELIGSKKGCDQGTCGACTVWVDGQRVLACLTLAVTCEGHEVTTSEGVGVDGGPHPMQRAFVEHVAFQCGYCTPGQIMSARLSTVTRYFHLSALFDCSMTAAVSWARAGPSRVIM